MTDQFERVSKIRKGELDSERPTYEELTGWIHRVPVTQLPGLLLHVVACCLSSPVFASDDKLRAYVDRLIKIWNEPHHGILREDVKP